MNRSKETYYLRGVIEAERLVKSLIERDLNVIETLTQMNVKDHSPKGHRDRDDFWEGWYDYRNYFLDNQDYIVYTKTKK